MFRRAILLAAWVLPAAASAAAGWTARVNEEQGLPEISNGGIAALTSSFAFWSKDWRWAEQQTRFKITRPYQYEVAGRNQTLDFDLRLGANRSSDRELTWRFELDAAKQTPQAIGGGIVFRFDLAKFGAELGEPELLPMNKGWAWGRPGQTRFEMRFDPALPKIYFERGQKSELRAFFYDGVIPHGATRYRASLSVTGSGQVSPSTPERFGLEDPTTWPADTVDWRTSPVDLSFLNAGEKPAGKRGFLRAVQDRLVFEDGREARFWGTNLSGAALFQTSEENVRAQARRLSQLGFNLVRLHHHDSLWVDPNVFGARSAVDGRTLDTQMLDRLDWWIKCLKEEGIYVWLDLHVGRQLKPGDGIADFDEILRGKPSAHLMGYNYVNPSIREAMKRFNEAYITHLNPHTGLRYKDDPAIAVMLLTNENDVTHHYGNALLPDKGVPRHNALYMAEALAFAARHQLSKERTPRSWEAGPSKLFLNDLEHRFNTAMIGHLRSLGVKVPIVTTSSWGRNPLISLPALTAGDMIDAHSYGGVDELGTDPVVGPNLMHWMAAAQVAGKPMSVSEWNVTRFPVADRHSIPLYLAASATLQGWSAVIQYAYAQDPANSATRPSNWHAFNDPGLLATLPAAALLYRRSDVQLARTTYVFSLPKERFFGELISPATSIALRTAAERGRLVIALPETPELAWLTASARPAGAEAIVDPDRSSVPRDAVETASDTGELRRNWGQGIFTVDTPRTQVATGWIGGRKISLSSVDIDVTTRSATVAVQSLDGKPIRHSASLLISLAARAVPASANQLPFHSEPLIGQLVIRARGGMTLHARINGRERRIAAPFRAGEYRVTLGDDLATHWLILKDGPRVEPKNNAP